MLPALAVAQSEIPALVRTVIPSGDASGGRIAYAIPLGDNRALQLNVDAGRLVVTISGAIKDQFKIFWMDGGEFIPLECSAGFLGALVGNISCRDVEPGTRLAFARKDLVDQLIPEAAIAEEGEAEEFVFEEEGEEEPSFFEGVADFFGFDEGEEIAEEEFETGEEFAFEGEEFAEESSFLDNVANFFGFGEEEEFAEEAVGGIAELPEGDEFAFEGGEFALEEGGGFAFEAGEVAPDEESSFLDNVADFFGFDEGEEESVEPSFAEAPEGEEFVFAPEEAEVTEGAEAPTEERLLPRIWREIRETAEAVQNKVADVIIKLYVKPLPLTSEAAGDEGPLLFDESAEEYIFIDEGAEFIEEPSAMNDQAPPAATVNEAFQRFINNLGQ